MHHDLFNQFLNEGCLDVSCLLQLFSKGEYTFFIPGPEEREEDRGFRGLISWFLCRRAGI